MVAQSPHRLVLKIDPRAFEMLKGSVIVHFFSGQVARPSDELARLVVSAILQSEGKLYIRKVPHG